MGERELCFLDQSEALATRIAEEKRKQQEERLRAAQTLSRRTRLAAIVLGFAFLAAVLAPAAKLETASATPTDPRRRGETSHAASAAPSSRAVLVQPEHYFWPRNGVKTS